MTVATGPCDSLMLLGWPVQLSQNGETFPGTSERVVLVSSSAMQPVLTAVSLVLQKVAEVHSQSMVQHRCRATASRCLSCRTAPQELADALTIDAKFAVPDGCAEKILGAGGATLQKTMQANGTQMALEENPFTTGTVARDPFGARRYRRSIAPDAGTG